MATAAPSPAPFGATQAALIQRLPWLAGWLEPPGQSRIPARDFLSTPFALATLGLSPRDLTPLSTPSPVLSAPAALRRLARPLVDKKAAQAGAAGALERAVVAGDTAAVTHATSVRPLDTEGPSGLTALSLAALLGERAVASALLAAGASRVAIDAIGNTPAHWAAIADDASLADWLGTRDGGPANRLGGRPTDYLAAWQRDEPKAPGVRCRGWDGRDLTPASALAFSEAMGFAYLPQVRPGVDFFVQLLVSLASDASRSALAAALLATSPAPHADYVAPPLFMKDFGSLFGWGVCTAQPLRKGTPVTSYAGDLIHTYELMVDALNFGVSAHCSNSQPSDALQAIFMVHIDGRRSGNLGSRINCAHTKDAANLGYDCRFWRGLPEVTFIARRDIAAGEQLAWYYGDSYWAQRGRPALPLPRF